MDDLRDDIRDLAGSAFRALPVAVLAIVLAACAGGGSAGPGNAAPGAPEATDGTEDDEQSEDSGSDTGDPVAEAKGAPGAGSVRLTVGSGPVAGTHEQRNVEVICVRGPGSTFTALYAAENTGGGGGASAEKGVHGISIEAGGTRQKETGTEFWFTVQLWRSGELVTYSMSPGPAGPHAKGSGTIQIDDRGSKASVRISGQSGEGPQLDLQLECDSLARL